MHKYLSGIHHVFLVHVRNGKEKNMIPSEDYLPVDPSASIRRNSVWNSDDLEEIVKV